jgi:predicted RNA binding protein YcfA (HicA-like mRNA interferase family)
MARPPILKPREVCRVLFAMGFILARQRGSHMQFRHADGRCTTVPNHSGRDVSPNILRQIIKDIGCTLEKFVSHL